MSDLPYLQLSDGFVTDPGADDFVHGDQLIAAVIGGCQCWINQIIDRLNVITNEENQLRDNLVRLRNLHPEVFTALGQDWDVMVECRLATTGPVPLAGLGLVDGTLPQEGDVVLVKDQADPSTHGPYVASAGLWSRWPGMADGDKVDSIYVWVTEGVENLYTSFVSIVDDGTVGTTEYPFIVCHKEFIPNLTADVLDALQGTAGAPSNTNRFVTDEDPRLDVFTAGQIGLVPDPFGFDCKYFLCADGTFQIPSEVAAEGFMRVDLDNIMDAAGFITFADTQGIRGLADPSDPGHAVNLNYFDTVVTAINAVLVGLTDWKQVLDAINGVIGSDGAGNYAEVTDPTFATATITGKLTVGGLIDPTGLQLTPVAGNPGDANTIWVDDGPGDLWFGAGNVTASIVANANAAAAAQADATQALADAAAAQADATQALADAAAALGAAAAAQADATVAKGVTDALSALNGILQCDGAGAFSVWDPVASAINDDSTYGGGGQSVAQSIDDLAAAAMAVQAYGEIYRTGLGTVCTVQNDWYEMAAGSAWTDGNQNLFNQNANGNLEYTGSARTMRIVATLSEAACNNAAPNDFELAVFKNGVQLAGSEQELENLTSSSHETVMLSCLDEAQTNDVYDLRVRCTTTGAIQFNSNRCNFSII